MKKVVTVLVLLASALLLFTACGSNDLSSVNSEGDKETKVDSYSVVGDWTYVGKDNNGNDVEIELDLKDDGNFSLEYLIKDAADEMNEKDAVVNGTYTTDNDKEEVGEGNGHITFSFEEVTDDNALLGEDVKAKVNMTLPYLVTDEDNMLTLTEAPMIFKDMTEQINFAREN